MYPENHVLKIFSFIFVLFSSTLKSIVSSIKNHVPWVLSINEVQQVILLFLRLAKLDKRHKILREVQLEINDFEIAEANGNHYSPFYAMLDRDLFRTL